MSQKNENRRTSKFLSLILRHQPELIGMQLDENGWLDVNALVQNARDHGHELSLELVHESVAQSDKQRFSLSEDGLRVRANQGHSIENVDLQLECKAPPSLLYHGTVGNFIDSIREQGLQKRARHHVHLSEDPTTAELVAKRRGKPIVLTVDSGGMHENGDQFFVSANGVWLVEAVPVKYIRFPS